MIHLRTKYFARLVPVNLFFTLVLSACTESTQPAPEPTKPAQYELTEIRYFLGPGDRIDTLSVPVKELRIQNPSNSAVTQQIEIRADDLIKTSEFDIDQATLLPTDVVLSNLAVRVPEGRVDSYFGETFTLSTTSQEKPYGSYVRQALIVSNPARSTINISCRIDAYHLVCSFAGLLTNKTTGQRYALSGKWRGLLRYNNLSTTLAEHPL